MTMLEQNVGPTEGANDIARTKLLMEAVESNFADFDIDRSNTLDRNELLSAFQGRDYSNIGDGLAILMNHYDEASGIASDGNLNPFSGSMPAQGAFLKTFGSDKDGGISLKDLDAIELVASSTPETKKFLDDLRGAEVLGGWKQVGWGLFNFGVGALCTSSPTGIGQVLGALNFGIAGIRAKDALNNFLSSDVPKFGEYLEDKRATIGSWKP